MSGKLNYPVVVTGTPRSGKSLIATLLSHDPSFHWISEPLTIWSLHASLARDDRRTASEATPAVRSAILAAIQARLQSGKRYLDDLSHHTLALPFLRAVLPDVRVIFVVRDGRSAVPEMMFGWTYRDSVHKAVARRWHALTLRTLLPHACRFVKNYFFSRLTGRRATWGPRVPGLSQFARTHDVAETAAFQWKTINHIALEDLSRLPRHTWLLVRFEDLLNNPAEQMRRIADFCQVRNINMLVEFAQQFIQPNHSFPKKISPTPAQWQAIGRIINPLQTRLGYPSIPTQSLQLAAPVPDLSPLPLPSTPAVYAH